MDTSPKEIVLNDITRFATRRLFYHGELWRQDVMEAFGLKRDVASQYMRSIRQQLSPVIDPEQSHRKLTLSTECELFSGFKKRLPSLASVVEGRQLLSEVMQSGHSMLESDRFGIEVQFDAAISDEAINAEQENTSTTRLPEDGRIDYTAAVRALIHKTVLSAHYVSMKHDDDPTPMTDRPWRYILPQTLRLIDGRLLMNAYACEDLVEYDQQQRLADIDRPLEPAQKTFVMTRFLSLGHVARRQSVSSAVNPATLNPYTAEDMEGIADRMMVGRKPKRRHQVTFNTNLSADQKEVLRRELDLDQAFCAYMDDSKAFFIRARYGISLEQPEASINAPSVWPLITEVTAVN